jgi:hypothetical protein
MNYFFAKYNKALGFNQDRCYHVALCLWLLHLPQCKIHNYVMQKINEHIGWLRKGLILILMGWTKVDVSDVINFFNEVEN